MADDKDQSCSILCSSMPCGAGDSDGERTHIRLQADQPVVAVPVYQEVQRRYKYIEVPQVELTDTVVPLVYNQSAVHDVPKMDVVYQDKDIVVENEKFIQREVEVPVQMGFAPHFVPKWDVRQVPRPVPKYTGEQQVIEIEVPQIEYKDTYVEKEVIVDVHEKIVPKVTEVVKEVEVMKYEWKEKYQDVPVYKYVPKFDVELDCPPPLIVPYPETRYMNDEPQTTRPYCSFSSCCAPPSDVKIMKAEQLYIDGSQFPQGIYPAVVPSNKMIIADTAFASEGLSNLPSRVPFEGYSGAAENIAIPYVIRGKLQGDAPDAERQTTLDRSVFSPGPVFPQPSPQVGQKNVKNEVPPCRGGTRLEKKRPSLWNWLMGKKEDSSQLDGGEKYGYPSGMPADFAGSFKVDPVEEGPQQDSLSVTGSAQGSSGKAEESNELEPTIVYRGSVNKPPEYAGELDPISFKLHAIEIHQFIPLPNTDIPEFVKALPGGILKTDAVGLEKFFGPVPAGWADPDVTGIPAPMMGDIISGKGQAPAASSELVCHLSAQFSKQGYVPGGTHEYTFADPPTANPLEPELTA